MITIDLIIALFLTIYGLGALNETADEHPFRLMAGPIGMLWLATLTGLV